MQYLKIIYFLYFISFAVMQLLCIQSLEKIRTIIDMKQRMTIF